MESFLNVITVLPLCGKTKMYVFTPECPLGRAQCSPSRPPPPLPFAGAPKVKFRNWLYLDYDGGADVVEVNNGWIGTTPLQETISRPGLYNPHL